MAVEAAINQLDGVLLTEYVTAEEVLEDFLGNHEDESAFAGLDSDFLRDRIHITVDTSAEETVVAELEQIQGVEDISVTPRPTLMTRLGFWLQDRLGY